MGGKKDKKKGKKKDAQGKGKKDSKDTGKKKKVVCPRCEEKIPAKSRFCPQCGCELQAAREEDHLMAELDTLDDLELPSVPLESARASQLPVTVPPQVAAAVQVPHPIQGIPEITADQAGVQAPNVPAVASETEQQAAQQQAAVQDGAYASAMAPQAQQAIPPQVQPVEELQGQPIAVQQASPQEVPVPQVPQVQQAAPQQAQPVDDPAGAAQRPVFIENGSAGAKKNSHKGTALITIRVVLGIMAIIFAGILIVTSVMLGVTRILFRYHDISAMMSLAVVAGLFLGGLLAILTRKRKVGTIISGLLMLLGAGASMGSVNISSDLMLLIVMAFAFGIALLVTGFIQKGSKLRT